MNLNRIELAKCYIEKGRTSTERKKKFELSFTTFANLKAQTHCAYSGYPFGDRHQFSFERIHNSIGYVDGNVIAVSRRLNSLRGDKDVPGVETMLRENIRKRADLYAFLELIRQDISLCNDDGYSVKPLVLAKPTKEQKEKIKTQLKLKEYSIARVEKYERCLARSDKTHTASWKKSLAKAKKSINHADRVIGLLLNKAPKVKAKTRFSTVTNLQSLNDNLAKTSKQIEELDLLIVELRQLLTGMRRFQTLSPMDRTKLKLGLSMDTKTTLVLKHKVAYNLLGGVL